MDHSDDQSDFAPDDDLLMQEEIMLLKMKAFHNNSMTEEEYEILEKEIKENFPINIGQMIFKVSLPNTGYHK